jgi:hypothetical protein
MAVDHVLTPPPEWRVFVTMPLLDQRLQFEYEVEPRGLPRVLCMVVYVLNEILQHVRTIRM